MSLLTSMVLGINEDVLNKNNNKLIKEGPQHPIYQTHKPSQSINQLGMLFQERHYFYLLLVITGSKINLRKDLCTLQLVEQIIIGNGYSFVIITLLISRQFTRIPRDTSFSFTNNISAPDDDTLGHISPLQRKSFSFFNMIWGLGDTCRS